MLGLLVGRCGSILRQRCISCRAYSSSNKDTPLSSSIRALMRSSAQPVAVITALLPPQHHGSESSSSVYAHGATLSSFSTVSLDPPLLAFSLQTPSRMADALQYKRHESNKAHFIVNMLSEKQADGAAGFAKPGLKPFSLGLNWETDFKIGDHDNDSNHPMSAGLFSPSELAQDTSGVSVPVLSDSLGSLSCSIVSSTSLRDFDTDAEKEWKSMEEADYNGSGSILFLARIHGVEFSAADSKRLPLIYWNQQFTSVQS